MNYAFILDLPDDIAPLSGQRLAPLAEIWAEQSARLKDNENYISFNEKLYRRWAIETGVIENLYNVERGTTEVLVEQGFIGSLIPHGDVNKPVDYVIRTLESHREVIDFLFDFVKGQRSLSTSFIKELHAVFSQTQDYCDARDSFGTPVQARLLKGEWKRHPNNPTRPDGSMHHYCPPEHVQAEMDRLLAMHLEHAERDIPPEVEASWLHHRFAQIHPFQDGNGRVARALASLVFIKAGLFPVIVSRDHKPAYIAALEQADQGNLKPLVQMFEQFQRDEIRKALSIAYDIERKQEQDELIGAIGRRIREKQEERHATMLAAATRSVDMLRTQTMQQLSRVAVKLNAAFQEALTAGDYHAQTRESDASNDHWYRNHIITIAQRHDYFADLKSYRSWCNLTIRDGANYCMVVSFHPLGYVFTGTMCVSAFGFTKESSEQVVIEAEPHRLATEPFIFTHKESFDEIKDNYAAWLDEVIKVALVQFQKIL